MFSTPEKGIVRNQIGMRICTLIATQLKSNCQYTLSSHLQARQIGERNKASLQALKITKSQKRMKMVKTRDSEVYLEQAENTSNELIINNSKTISQEEFNNMNWLDKSFCV